MSGPDAPQRSHPDPSPRRLPTQPTGGQPAIPSYTSHNGHTPSPYWDDAPPPLPPKVISPQRNVSGSRPALPTPPGDLGTQPANPPSLGRRPLPKPPGPPASRPLPSLQDAGPSRTPSQTYSLSTGETYDSGTSLSHFSQSDGRGTPTQQKWEDYASLRAGNRVRHTSSSSIGLPATPNVAPMTTLTHQRSFIDLPHQPVETPPTPNRHTSLSSSRRRSSELSASWATQTQPPAQWVERKLQIHQGNRDEDGEYIEEEEWEEEAEVNEMGFFQPAYLSEAAVQLRDKVERQRHLKAGIAWVGSFTGRDIVVS